MIRIVSIVLALYVDVRLNGSFEFDIYAHTRTHTNSLNWHTHTDTHLLKLKLQWLALRDWTNWVLCLPASAAVAI